MGGRRFPVGEIIAIVGAVGVVVGVSLIWFVLRIDADSGKAASFALMGWEFTLGMAAAIVAAIGGLFAVAGVFLSGVFQRVVAIVVVLCGIAALSLVLVQVIDPPDVTAMNEEVGQAFSSAELKEYDASMASWNGITADVDSGLGLWVALAATFLVVAGGGVAAALGGAKAPAAAAGGTYPVAVQPPPHGVPAASPQPGYYPQPAAPAQQSAHGQPATPLQQGSYGQPAMPSQSVSGGSIATASSPDPTAPQVPPPAPAASQVPPVASGAPAVSQVALTPPPPPSEAREADAPVAPDARPEAAGEADAPGAPPEAAAEAATAAPAPAKFCAKCGGSFGDDATRFCTTCGAPRPGVG